MMSYGPGLQQREAMVLHLADWLRKLGFQLSYYASTDLKDAPVIGRHAPDILGKNEQGLYCIGVVKTLTELLNKKNWEQVEDYTRYRDAWLFMCVPEYCQKNSTYLKQLPLTIPMVSILYYPETERQLSITDVFVQP